MYVDVKVPVLAETIPDATLLDWKKQAGDAVVDGEILIELETDKVVLEVPAPASGVLAEILKSSGDTVLTLEVLARIDTEATAPASAPSVATTAPESAAAARLSPAVRKLVDEHQLDPAAIAGTGKDGRLTKGDVLAYVEKLANSPPAAAPATVSAAAAVTVAPLARAPVAVAPVVPGSRNERREPMSRMRSTIASRLKDAQNTAAILTTFNEVNMDPVVALRTRYKEAFEKAHNVRLGFMSFFAKAAVQALQRYPAVNAYIDGANVVYHDYCDIGVAVGSPRGLVVPILRNVEAMSFANVEQSISHLGGKAADGSLSLDDLTGGTFTISNGGVFGSMLSTPILNPPQSAILGMHKTQDRPVVEDGQIVIRPMMYLALSYDHRIIDGREAVLFLVAIKDAIEDPARLLLEV